jgi:hypothetical protein
MLKCALVPIRTDGVIVEVEWTTQQLKPTAQVENRLIAFVAASGFEHGNSDRGVFRQTAGNDGTGRAAAHYHIVEFMRHLITLC